MAAPAQAHRHEVLTGASSARQHARLLEALDQRASHRISRPVGIAKTFRDNLRAGEKHGQKACPSPASYKESPLW